MHGKMMQETMDGNTPRERGHSSNRTTDNLEECPGNRIRQRRKR